MPFAPMAAIFMMVTTASCSPDNLPGNGDENMPGSGDSYTSGSGSGSSGSGASNCTSSYRDFFNPSYKYDGNGFRLCCSAGL